MNGTRTVSAGQRTGVDRRRNRQPINSLRMVTSPPSSARTFELPVRYPDSFSGTGAPARGGTPESLPMAHFNAAMRLAIKLNTTNALADNGRDVENGAAPYELGVSSG